LEGPSNKRKRFIQKEKSGLKLAFRNKRQVFPREEGGSDERKKEREAKPLRSRNLGENYPAGKKQELAFFQRGGKNIENFPV